MVRFQNTPDGINIQFKDNPEDKNIVTIGIPTSQIKLLINDLRNPKKPSNPLEIASWFREGTNGQKTRLKMFWAVYLEPTATDNSVTFLIAPKRVDKYEKDKVDCFKLSHPKETSFVANKLAEMLSQFAKR